MSSAGRRWLRFRGKCLSVAGWARELGIPSGALSARLKRGWSVTRTLSTPKRLRERKLRFRNKALSIADWARELGLSHSVLSNRLSRGWPVRRALGTPLRQVSLVEHNGERRTVAGWARKLRFSAHAIRSRLGAGWPVSLALTPLLCHTGNAGGLARPDYDYLRRLAQRGAGWHSFRSLLAKGQCPGTDDMARLRYMAARGLLSKRERPGRLVEWRLTARGRRVLTRPPPRVLGIQSLVHRHSHKSQPITHNGRTQNLSAWACELGVSRQTLHQRIKRGWKSNRVLSPVLVHPARRGYRGAVLSFRSLTVLAQLAKLGAGWHTGQAFTLGDTNNRRHYGILALKQVGALLQRRDGGLTYYQISPKGRRLLRRHQRRGTLFTGQQA